MKITEEKILNALSKVIDPDFGKDLVTLGMIENVVIEGLNVSFTIVLTTPACPLKDKLSNDSKQAIADSCGDNIVVTIDFASRVTTKREDINLLPGVKNIIAVASGKGGVGKSTIAVNLAHALAKNNALVGIIDADIYGPSIPLMMGLQGERPQVTELNGKHMILPLEKNGVKVLSIGFLVDDRQAVVWRGPMVASALRQFVTDCIWGDLDYLIIDLPPGTGDIHLSLVQTVPVTGAVIVTTPQEIALADARKAVSMFTMQPVNVPILGIVENMSYFTPAELPENKYYLFGQGGGKKLSDEFQLPLLAEIPLVQGIREGGDHGKPVVLQQDPLMQNAFNTLAKNVAQQVSIRNANLNPTKTVKITA